MLELAVREGGDLDPLYCSAQPLERRQQNLPHLLAHHLNHPANAALLPRLLAAAAGRMGPGALRLLRLLCRALFRGDAYRGRARIARGAYAQASGNHAIPLRCPLKTSVLSACAVLSALYGVRACIM